MTAAVSVASSTSDRKRPLEAIQPGARVRCRGRDGLAHEAEVLEVRPLRDGGAEYYVHYPTFDRRLDEWVAADRLAPDTGPPAQPASPPPPSAPEGEKKARAPRLPSLDGEEGLDPSMAALAKRQEEDTRVRNFDFVVLGAWDMEAWYFSPFAPEIMGASRKVVICEWCLRYMRKRRTLARHLAGCHPRHPPGTRIYSHGNVSVFEVDGAVHERYCQCLCLIARLFLDHKAMYFEVKPFLFYVMTLDDAEGQHVVGFFSKERVSLEDCNLACLLTLPPYQGRGYGHALIQFSYELTKLEGRVGGPERPLSDLGKAGYLAYWQRAVLLLMWERREASVRELSRLSGIAYDDVVYILSALGFLSYYKGEHKASVSLAVLGDRVAKLKAPAVPILPDKIAWVPRPPPSKRDSPKPRGDAGDGT